jgi:asparagine synthase (glutamine-hydrolysing)
MDERGWARQIVDAFPNIDPIYCSPSDEDVRLLLDDMMRAHEVPIRSSAAVSYYFVMKVAARMGLKVMLEGHGADGYLAGALSGFERLISRYLRKLRVFKAFAALNDYASLRSTGRRELALNSVRAAVRDERALYATEYLDRCSYLGFDGDLAFSLRTAGRSRLKQYLYHELLSTGSPMVLHPLDRMSMAFSIESRVPFFDHRLVEFAHSLHDEDLLFGGHTKYILRESLDGYLPKAIANRVDKQGLTGREIVAWLRGPLRHLIEAPIDFDRLGMLHRGKTQEAIERFRNGSNAHVHLLWRLVSLNHWLKLNRLSSQPANLM